MNLSDVIRFATVAHAGQYREDGSPYINHPLAVLQLLWHHSIDLPLEVYMVAVLHDILEDTSRTYDDLLALAGQNVAASVRALTKDASYYTASEKLREKQYLERIRQITEVYPYTLLVKIFDRIHNVHTCSALSLMRKKRLLIETEKIYIPFLARHCREAPIGLRKIYKESLRLLEDVVFQHTSMCHSTYKKGVFTVPARPPTHTSPY